MKNYPVIGIVGTSGSGKSRSIKNLPPESTVILNIENKPLPFIGANKFTRNIEISDVTHFDNEFDKAIKDPTVKVIILESLTSYCDALVDRARKIMKGWDIWNYHNDKLSELMLRLKNNGGKLVIVIAVDEVVKMMSASGIESAQRRIKVDGKKHEGKIEYNFTITLFTLFQNDKHWFVTNSDGLITAKSPEGMFAQLIPNDLNEVVNRVMAYYEMGEKVPITKP